MKTITIDGTEYVPKSEVTAATKKAKKLKGMEYVICRTYSAGVFAGYIEKEEGQEVTLRQARRIWYWDGAASLSQLATNGTSKPENCKFPCTVDIVRLKQVIEIIPCTKEAQESINSVPIWKQ